jgi:periplasmic divalent cation tolerance protein
MTTENNILVMTTTGSKEEAEKLAKTMVERRLAACVNIVPQVQSVYRWNDKVERAEEFLLLIKTYGTALDRVRSLNREMNSYDLPECISFKIDGGCSAYLKWLGNSVE